MGLLESSGVFSLGLATHFFSTTSFALSTLLFFVMALIFLRLFLHPTKAHRYFLSFRASFFIALFVALISGYISIFGFFLALCVLIFFLLCIYDFCTLLLPLWLLALLYFCVAISYNFDLDLLIHALAICGGLALLGILAKILYKKDALGEGDVLVMLPLAILLGANGALGAIFLGSIVGLIFFFVRLTLKMSKISELPFVSLLGAGGVFWALMNGARVV